MPSISLGNMAVDSPLCASCPLYKRERAAPIRPLCPSGAWNSIPALPRGAVARSTLVRSVALSFSRYRTLSNVRFTPSARRGKIFVEAISLRLCGENCSMQNQKNYIINNNQCVTLIYDIILTETRIWSEILKNEEKRLINRLCCQRTL